MAIDPHSGLSKTGRSAYTTARSKGSTLGGEALFTVASGAVAALTGASRATIDRLAAEAGFAQAGAWQRLGWLLQSSRPLFKGWLLRKAGGIFDRWVREYRSGGFAFTVPPELTTLETRGEFLLHRYESVERRFTRKYIPADATVLELGGCLGVVACAVNRRLADPRRHVVFEPHPQIAAWLEANRDRNRCRFQIRRQVIGAGGPAAFYLRDPYVGGSSLLRPSGRRIAVESMTIAALESETGFSFDALIVDIEGGESAFFAENADLLGRARQVIVEFHPQIIGEEACEASRARLKAAGLSPVDRRGCVEAWARRGS